MKRTRRLNRISHRRPKKPNRFWPIAIAVGAVGALLQFTLIGAVVVAIGAGANSYYQAVSTAGLQRLRQHAVLENVQPTVIEDRNGKHLLEIRDPNKGLQTIVPLKDIPVHYMQDALIATEDHTFWSNSGIDPTAIGRALKSTLTGGRVEGASTLTQQMVKRLVLNSQQTPQRKLQEIAIAYAAGQQGSGISKQDILYLYFNSVFFGHHATGIEAAARVYFGRHVWQLDLAQSALLAGLVNAPGVLDPIAYGPGFALHRMRYVVLKSMVTYGYITAARARAAYAEAQTFSFSEPHLQLTTSTRVAPYWTDWIEGLLGYPRRSWTDDTLANLVATKGGGFTNGLTIRTTLDLGLYQHTQQVMSQRVQQLATDNVNDAAVVTLDPHTGECWAMVGGINYNSAATGSQINMAAYPRSPGSSFKVYTYLTAFEQGQFPATVLPDEPKQWADGYNADGSVNTYAPMNYDRQFHGAVTIRTALANSFNIPAVETIDAVGPNNVARTAEDMGVTDLRRGLRHVSKAPLSMTLGSEAVPLWQMAQGYDTLANNGAFRPMASIRSIQDANGATLYTYHVPAPVQVVAPQYAYMLTSILKDNYARTIAFGPNSALQLGPDLPGQSFDGQTSTGLLPVNVPAAVKTGTSESFKDNLTIGYTPNLLTATWVGNPDNSAMLNVEGVTGAGPIWHDVMEWDLTHLNKAQPQEFAIPPGMFLAKVSGTTPTYLANGYTRWPITDVFAAGGVPHQYDNGGGAPPTAPMLYSYGAYDLDGGTTGAGVNGAVPLTSVINVSATTGLSATNTNTNTNPAATPGTTGASPGSTGIVTYNPGQTSDICGGGRYRYYPQYVNGRLEYAYTCQ